MPLIFEINENNNILCFVPSGYRSGAEFVDFPAQYGASCWHHAAFRLFTLSCTENGFDLTKQAQIVQRITSLKDFISNLEKMKEFWEIMACQYFKNKQNDLETFKARLLTIDSIAELKGIFNFVSLLDAKFEYALAKILAENKDIFFNEFINILTVIVNEIPTPNKPNIQLDFLQKIIEQCYEKFLCEKLEEFMEEPLVVKVIEESKIIFSLDTFRLFPQKMRINGYFKLIESMLYKGFGLTTITNSANVDPNLWSHILFILLQKNGPIMVHGYVGSVFYPNCMPKKVAEFGSLLLYGFESSKYVNSKIGGHVVLIIGLVDNKVIYLDPTDESCINAPRRAYVMNINKFMERVIEFQNSANDSPHQEKNVAFTQLPKDAIDTSIDLMLQQLYSKDNKIKSVKNKHG